MATTAQIDSAFRLAGFTKGRPTQANADAADVSQLFPAEAQTLVDLFNDSLVEGLQLLAGETQTTIDSGAATTSKGFIQLMAAAILETLMTTGLDTDGRPLSVTSISTADFSRSYTDPLTASELTKKRAATLRSQARLVGASV